MSKKPLQIIMNARNVRRIIDEIEHPGTGKTETRRLLYTLRKVRNGKIPDNLRWSRDHPPPRKCPPIDHCYALSNWFDAKVGDVLWIRENFRVGKGYDGMKASELPTPDQTKINLHYEADGDAPVGLGKLRPAIFMPYWASRITAPITGVKIEPLKSISEEDAKAEGAKPAMSEVMLPYTKSFQQTWSEIHGQESWDANPVVVAVTFKPYLQNVLDFPK